MPRLRRPHERGLAGSPIPATGGGAGVPDAFEKIAGTDRLVLYDVPSSQAPRRMSQLTPFVTGGDSWWAFILRRRRIDDGNWGLVISLRRLPEPERLLVIDWGTYYANALFLIEPTAGDVDLTKEGGWRSGKSEELESRLRTAYGVWHYWTRTADDRLKGNDLTLDLSNRKATIASSIEQLLPRLFPPRAFRSALFSLNAREGDLFIRKPVRRMILPFLTRLGLPVPYDWTQLLDGLKDLVNSGLAAVEDRDKSNFYQGPNRPLPPDIDRERLLSMLRTG